MRKYLNVRSIGRWVVALVPLLFMAGAFGGWRSLPASAGESTEVAPMDRQQPQHIETATFALGWFWGPDSQFGSIPGVIRTRVGYSGGEKKNPTYHNLGGHSETVEIDFDPTVVTYKELLDEFWQGHDPTSRSWSRQYMSAIFYHNEEQKRLAQETKEREEKRRGKAIQTKILPFTSFTLAEDYHQKHNLRFYPDVLAAVSAPYRSDFPGFVNSTVVTRLNGFLGGNGHYSDLEAEIDSYGLSPSIKKEVLDKAQKLLAKKPASACPVN